MNFRDLRIWILGQEIAVYVYSLTKIFPKDELFGLVSQMRRAAVSISSNIAEGFNRRKTRDFQRFLYIALGSCAELENQLELCFKLGYIDLNKKKISIENLQYEGRMIRKLVERFSLGTRNQELGTPLKE